jgi:hypothetical protein
VLCYLGFTYKDDLKENRLEAAIEANREKAWIKAETEYWAHNLTESVAQW